MIQRVMVVESIEDVIRALDEIVDWAWNSRSRIGYFAALYRRVTRAVKDGIAQGKFQNGPLMERLDVSFASRYLQALQQFRSEAQCSLSWQVAFEAASRRRPLVLQHLLAGINAHINLDLGIATAMTAPGHQLTGIQADFDQINGVLASLVHTVESEIAEISPLIGLLETFSIKTDTVIIDFSLEKAREFAWGHAVSMSTMQPPQLQAAIEKLDPEVAELGRLVVSPPWLITIELLPVQLFETSNVRRVLDVLARERAIAAAAATV